MSAGPRAVAAAREPRPRRGPGSRRRALGWTSGVRPPPPNCASVSSAAGVGAGAGAVSGLCLAAFSASPAGPARGPLVRLPGAPAPAPPPPAPHTLLPCAVVSRVRLGPLQLLPKRLDWEGNEHNRSYEELRDF